VQAFVDGTPELRGEIVVEGRKITAPKRGTELHILAADSAGSHGLRPCWLVVDELANWPDTPRHREFFDSLWAGLAKTRGRGIVITTPGSPAHFSHEIYEAAKSDPMWRVSHTLGPPPWVDPAEVESERLRLLPSVFARLWMAEWQVADDAIAEQSDVDAACVLEESWKPQEGTRYICTLDLGTRHDNTALVVAHSLRSEDREIQIIVDAMRVWTPKLGRPVSLDEVRAEVGSVCRQYRAPLHFDPSQAYLMAEQLRADGISCHEFLFTASSVGQLAVSLAQALRARRILLPNDKDLRNEIMSVRLRETSPNVLKIDTRTSRQHDDRVIACAMACRILTSTRPGGPIIFTDAELNAMKFAEAQAFGVLPKPVAAIPGRAFGGSTAMPGSTRGKFDLEDEQASNGATKRSPFR
jgi:phage terminase large subunit-like protein